MADKTIKELADSLGVSKDRVKYQLRKLPSKFTYKKGNITYLKKEAVSTITKILSVDNQVELPTNFLLNEIETKNNYIKEKDKQIEKLQSALATQQKLLDQQQLHLQANQRIEHLEKQLAIEPPREETTNKKDEEAFQSYQKKIEELKKQAANKKWFKFWKK